MRTIKTILFSLTILLFTFSCDKDEKTTPEEEKTNAFTYKGQELSLSAGYYDSWVSGDISEYYIFLASTGVSFNASEWTGSGSVIYFGLVSSEKEGLAEGEYIYDYDNGAAMHTYEAIFELDTNYDSNTGDEELAAISGKVNVSKEGNIYEITFNFVLENDESISGYYKGNLTQSDNL